MPSKNGLKETAPGRHLSQMERLALASAMAQVRQAQVQLQMIMTEMGLDPNAQYSMTPEGVLQEIALPKGIQPLSVQKPVET